MVRLSSAYQPRDPTSILHQIVRDHFEAFRAHAASLRDGDGLPRFVEQEFRDFLRFGCLAGGFARFRCGDCGLDRLVPFSCNGRALCPSCGGRRMAERAAHLVDHVFPDVPVRPWVLSLPYRLRYRLAWDHDLCRRVAAVFIRAVFRVLRGHARAARLEQARGGAVAVIQRFGGALNLNVHIHALVLDGVFARDPAGAVAFHPAPRLTTLDVAEVLAAVEPRIRRLLDRRGLAEGNAEGGGVDAWAGEAPVLAGLAAASVQEIGAFGRHPGTRPIEFLGRLAVLVPRPRVNLILYYGVLGARAAWRSEVVPRQTADQHLAGGGPPAQACATDPPDPARRRARGQRWADLMRRTFGLDVLVCPRCGGRLRLISLIEEAAVIARILRHLGLPTDLPVTGPARAPPPVGGRRRGASENGHGARRTPACSNRAPERRPPTVGVPEVCAVAPRPA